MDLVDEAKLNTCFSADCRNVSDMRIDYIPFLAKFWMETKRE